MTISKGQRGLLKLACKQLRLSDDDYRAILLRLADVDSSTKLTQAGFDVVLAYLEHLGFAPLRTVGSYYGERDGMASPRQVQFIRDMWARYSGATDWAALDAWLSRSFGVASLRFTDDKTAGKAITALRAMTHRPAAVRRKAR